MRGTAGNGTRAAETAARKRRILNAAVALAASGGYEGVQMRDVASEADVALGTLYRHYPSKDHLLISALAREAEGLLAGFSRRPPAGSTPSERVSDALRRASRALERDPQVTAALITALASTDADAVDSRTLVADRLHAIIGEAIDGDEATGDLADLADLVRVLGYVWWAVLNTWVANQREVSMADELATAAHLLLDGR